MATETKPKTFTKGGNPLKTWGQGFANALGVTVVKEQSQAPKPEFATASTVDKATPTLGENAGGEGLPSSNPLGAQVEAPMTPRDSLGVPAAVSESNLNVVPPVPAAVSVNSLNQVPPVPATAETTIINNSASKPFNTVAPSPTETPPMPPTIPEVPEPAVSQPPVNQTFSGAAEPAVVQTPEPEIVTPQVSTPEPDEKTDTTSSMPEPKIVDVKEDEAPTVVPPSMGTPTIVSDVPPVETTKPADTPAPDVFQSAFQDESQDYLDPLASSSTQPEPENTQKSEFDVKINPIAERLLKERPREFISLDVNNKPIFNAAKFDEQLFVKEVQEEPTFKNFVNQLGKRGVSLETTIDALKELIEV